jgi:hypothetical protein
MRNKWTLAAGLACTFGALAISVLMFFDQNPVTATWLSVLSATLFFCGGGLLLYTQFPRRR